MNDEEDLLLGSPIAETHVQRSLRLMELCLLDLPMNGLLQSDVDLVMNAMEKVRIRMEEEKKTVLKEEDILDLGRIKMNSVTSSESTSADSVVSRCSAMDVDLDFELDYEEDIEPQEKDDSIIIDDVEEEEREVKVHQESRTPTPEAKASKSIPIVWISSDSESETKENASSGRQSGASSGKRSIRNDNVSDRDFPKSLTKEKQFLKMKKKDVSVDNDKLKLIYPLGVTYDDISKSWYMTDQKKNMVVAIRNSARKEEKREFKVITDMQLLRSPSAITVYKEGSDIAVLCSDAYARPRICLINIEEDMKVEDFCNWKDKAIDFAHEARGLARSLAGNLITMDKNKDIPRLRLFTSGLRQKTFELTEAHTPSFLASSGDTVVVTDLGARDYQKVFMIKLDDSNWADVDFKILRVISNGGLNLTAQEMLNKQYFMYVAGVQIDKAGNIIIADAKNHHFKFFKNTGGFIHRISTDFPVPYVSSFHVNQKGEVLILSTREDEKITFARLTSTEKLEPHIPVKFRKRADCKSIFSSGRGRKTYRCDSPDSAYSGRSTRGRSRKSPKLN